MMGLTTADAFGYLFALSFSLWVIGLGAYRLGRIDFVIWWLFGKKYRAGQSIKDVRLIALGLATIAVLIISTGINDWRYHQKLRLEITADTITAADTPILGAKTVSLVMDLSKVDRVEFIDVDTQIAAGMIQLNQATGRQAIVISGEGLRQAWLNRAITSNPQLRQSPPPRP